MKIDAKSVIIGILLVLVIGLAWFAFMKGKTGGNDGRTIIRGLTLQIVDPSRNGPYDPIPPMNGPQEQLYWRATSRGARGEAYVISPNLNQHVAVTDGMLVDIELMPAEKSGNLSYWKILKCYGGK